MREDNHCIRTLALVRDIRLFESVYFVNAMCFCVEMKKRMFFYRILAPPMLFAVLIAQNASSFNHRTLGSLSVIKLIFFSITNLTQ